MVAYSRFVVYIKFNVAALKLDAHDILLEKEFSPEENDNQYSIANKTKRDIAVGLVETLNNISKDSIEILKTKQKTSYNRAPTKEQVKEFHEKGLKVIKIKHIKFVLAKEFS